MSISSVLQIRLSESRSQQLKKTLASTWRGRIRNKRNATRCRLCDQMLDKGNPSSHHMTCKRISFFSQELPVQTTGWLVQKEQSRAGQDLQSNTQPPLLTTTESSQVPVPYWSVPTFMESHLLYCALYYSFLFSTCYRAGKAQTCRVVDCLFHS